MKWKNSAGQMVEAHASITPERILEAAKRELVSLDNPGLCLACGEEAESVEPDARRLKCECCDERAVYGAEELLLRLG